MNKILLTLCLILLGLAQVNAQIPSGLNFQGIARGADGIAITNESVIVQISILDNTNGTIDFSETHDLTTDAAGLFSLVIGSGENISGVYEGLEWSISRDVSVGIDVSADGSFDIEFTTPFQSVPYANYSKYTENVDDADADPNNEIQSISIDGSEISLSDGGNISLPTDQVNDADANPTNEIQSISINGSEITLSDGGSIVLPTAAVDPDEDPSNELQSISIDGSEISLSDGGSISLPADQINDADADPSNELQSISIDGSMITLSDGGSIVLPTAGVDADADPSNELQTISIDGSTIILSDGGSIVLPTDGVDADADPSNELQSISIDGSEISLSDGGSISLPADQVNDADADPSNELQSISIDGSTITLSDGGSIVLPTDGVDADADPSNELQTLSLEGNLLSLSDGNTVELMQSSVIVGTTEEDVPAIPEHGQLYFDETNDKFYVYHAEGWTLIELGGTTDEIYPTDSDEDGSSDNDDNCPDDYNPNQEDLDNDDIGDVCDDDIDGDNIDNDSDNCPESYNPDQEDLDNDNLGDVCDTDIDGDGILNNNDDCPEDFNPDQVDTDLDGCEDEDNGLHPAFAEFDSGSYTIYLNGDEVVIETDGLPNHESPYWSDGHPLDIDPVCTTDMFMAPGDIDNFNGSFTLTVPVDPELASSSSATGLGPIGLAISGSVIYNDEEGPGIPLDNAVGSLDCNGAHTGPQSYHYHLEPVAWSEDDENLIGIMSDGFFLYGRRDYDGSYPSDLDASGGHFGPTPHNADGEYHYHIQNALYLNEYYILFPGDYQGTPNGIN